VPTSKKPQINNAQYLRIPNKIFKPMSHEEVINDVVAEVVVSRIVNDEALRICWSCEQMECRYIQISCIVAKSLAEPPEACRPHEGLKSKAPKHPEIFGRAIRRAPDREAFISDVKFWVSTAS
jgi:hypothetical protein